MLLNTDFKKLLVDELPDRFRKPKFKAWFECLIKPLEQLYSSFSTLVLWSRKQLSYNSQTIVFEGGLNDTFDSLLRRIYILNDPAGVSLAFEYSRSENQPDEFDYARSEGKPDEFEFATVEYNSPVGFWVMVPTSLLSQEKAIRTFVERIKFSHIKYDIKYF